MTIFFATTECYLGQLLLSQTETGICAISIGDDASKLISDLQKQFPQASLIANDSSAQHNVKQLEQWLAAPHTHLTFPLDLQGTAFQKQVWQALQNIPLGSTTTYTKLAQTLGKPKAIRAVANACAANNIALLIPCHRVIRSDGTLSGYRWGIDRKQTLLDSEQRHAH